MPDCGLLLRRPALRVSRSAGARSPRCRLISLVPDGPGHDHRDAINPEKRERGWRAEHDFAGRLVSTVRWYLDNRAWWEPLRKGVYSGERLGLIKAAE